MDYCYTKLRNRIIKLKKDLVDNEGKIKDEIYIKSFLDKTKINVNDMHTRRSFVSKAYCEYHQLTRKDSTILKKILKHIKKVGSYTRSLMEITDCICKEKYKNHFLVQICTY